MTLHWWMHWFWVTTLLTLQHCSGRALAAPQSEELQQITTDIEPEPNRPSNRQGRAMYFTKTPPVTSTTNRPTAVLANETKPTENMTISRNDTDPRNNVTLIVNATQGIVHPSVNWTPINGTDTTRTTSLNNTKREETTKNATESTVAPIKTNATEVSSTTLAPTKKRNNLTRHPDIKEIDTSIEGVAESRIVTEKPLSLETSYLQTIIPPSIESSRRINDQGSYEQGGMDTGAIAGISFAALVLTALAGSTAFVLYRRRYLNKPQTLNDKCSNPDSSGYLDDSTIRDNSEEMYSLDNDSFLNSLEAMTIQNYWTDTVKHTKL